MPTRKLEVSIIGDASSLQKAFGKASKSSDGFGKSLAHVGKIAVVGLAAGIGAAAYAATKFAKAALEAEKSQTRLANAFDHVKASAGDQGRAMEAVNKVMNQSGLDDEDLKDSLARLVTVTGDVTKAQRDMGIAADVARARGIDLAAATKIVEKAELGNVGALKRIGIEVPKVTAATDALKESHKKATKAQKDAAAAADVLATKVAAITALQTKFGGAAAKFGKTAAGEMDRFKVAIHNVEEGLGAALLPTLGRVAGGVATFLNKFNEAKGVSAKVSLIWETVKTTGAKLTEALGNAIASVDWAAAWSKAQGIGAGLANRFKQIDWTSVGTTIGDGIAVGISNVGEIGKKVATVLTEASRKIDWQAFGRAVGPGLATALVAAFVTLTDVGFWAKNWDLALAVGLTAFGGSLERIGLRLLLPFRRLGTDAVLAMGAAIEKASPKLAAAFIAAVERVPRLLFAPFRKIEEFVRTTTTKLDNLAFFTLKVLGVEAAIHAVAHFASDVYARLRHLTGQAGSAAADVGHAIVHGITQGIYETGVGAIKAAAEWLSNLIPGWMKKLLHISSPSQLMADQIGKPVTEGVAAGMRAGLPSITSAVAAVVAGIGKLQGQLDAINARRESEDRASAVRDAITAVAEARKKGEGVAAAEQALARAREDIVTAGISKRIALESAGLDKITAAVDTKKAKVADAFAKLGEFASRAFDAKTQKMLDKVSAKFDKLIAKVQAAGDALTPAEQALKDLDKAEGARQRGQALTDAQASGDPEQIRQAQLAITRAALEDQAAVERTAQDKATQVRIAALEAAKAQELQNLNERRDQLGAKLDEQLGVLQTKLANHPAAYAKNQAAIVKLLNSFGISYKEAGTNLGTAFANGMDEAQKEVRKSAAALAHIVQQYLKLGSPSEKGPMSDLNTWWRSMSSTLASGVNSAPVAGVAASVAASPAGGGMGGGGGSTTIQLVLDGRVISEIVRNDLIQIGRRNGSALGGLA